MHQGTTAAYEGVLVSQWEVARRGVREPRVRGQRLGGNTVQLVRASRGIAPVPNATATATATGSCATDWRRQQLSHDIRHELATVMMLASLLVSGHDVGPDGRRRASQLLEEARWLLELQNAYQDSAADGDAAVPPSLEPIRLDVCARQTVAALELSSPTTIELDTSEVWATADRLAFWRALRNIVGNAVRAAGPAGRVILRVERSDRWAAVQVDDDGPGFGAACSGIASMGLDIVYESVASCGGNLEIRRGALGGCCVRLSLPATSVPDSTTVDITSLSDGFRSFDALADL
jgi:signal transduction histidine kinase